MGVNRKIIVMVVGISAAGVYNALVKKQSTVTKVLIGAYVLALILSLADLLGGQVSQLVGGIAMIALFTALFYVMDVFSILSGALSKNKAASSGSSGSSTL